MSVVPVTISGVAYPKNKKDPPMPVTIVGFAWITGLGVGGGPAEPPLEPTHPIVLPPVEIPPPEIPVAPTEPKPPPADGGWGWSPNYGWGYFPAPGEATPKRR